MDFLSRLKTSSGHLTAYRIKKELFHLAFSLHTLILVTLPALSPAAPW